MFMSIIGILVILAVAFVFCEHKKSINYRTIVGAFSIQVFFAIIALYTTIGRNFLESLANFVNGAMIAGRSGIGFMFGPLADGNIGFVFGISVLCMIIFFASLVSVLYYLKIMPLIINTIGFAIHKVLKTTRAESLSATANIFLGQTEAPLVVKPFIEHMSKSELFAVMVGGLASVAGSVLVGYASLGVNLKYLIAASFMAAPAGLLMAKIIIPETQKNTESKKLDTLSFSNDSHQPVNIIEAATSGALSGLQLVLNIGAILIAFIGLISLVDIILSWGGGLFGYNELSLKLILGYAFSPIAFIIGVPWNEAVIVGSFLGQKLVLNEFVAFISLTKHMNNLSEHSQIIATFALCGFANLSSIGILIGGIGSMAPNHKTNVAKLAVKAILAGTLANLMSATLAGLFTSI